MADSPITKDEQDELDALLDSEEIKQLNEVAEKATQQSSTTSSMPSLSQPSTLCDSPTVESQQVALGEQARAYQASQTLTKQPYDPRVNLRAEFKWKKGQSGNPRGRPPKVKIEVNAISIMLGLTQKAAQVLRKRLHDEQRPKEQMDAAKFVLNWALKSGKLERALTEGEASKMLDDFESMTNQQLVEILRRPAAEQTVTVSEASTSKQRPD